MPAASHLRLVVCLSALLLITMIIAPTALSQRAMWPNGTKLLQAGEFGFAIPDGKGGAVMAFSRPRRDTGADESVLQRADNRGILLWHTGTVLPDSQLLGSDGMVGDCQQGFFVVSVSTQDFTRITKVDSYGRLRWIQSLTTTPGFQALCARPTILNDGSIVVVFWDSQSSGTSLYRVQRISATGRRLCGDHGFGIVTQGAPLLSAAVDSYGGVLAAIQDEYGGPGIRLRYHLPSGSVAWTRTISPSQPDVQRPFVKLAADDDGGLVCLYAYDQWLTDMRIQRLSKSGQMLWCKGKGIPLFATQPWKEAARMELLPYKHSVLVWCAAPASDIYACRYDLTGRAIWKQDAPVCTYPYPAVTSFDDDRYWTRPADMVEATADKDGNLLFSWRDLRSWDSLDDADDSNEIYVGKVSASGQMPWTPNGFRVPHAPWHVPHSQDHTQNGTVPDGEGGMLVLGNVNTTTISPCIAMQRIVPGDGPPSTPYVQDDGWFYYSLDSLSARMISSDTQHSIVEYEYAIGTSTAPGEEITMQPTKSNGADPNIVITGQPVRADRTYYFTARAKNSVGLWSSPGWSDGVLPVDRASSLAEAVTKPADWRVLLPPVTVVSTDGTYWFVRDTPDGPTYRVDVQSSRYAGIIVQPGDVFSLVCTADDWYEGGRYLKVVHVIDDQPVSTPAH